LSTDPASKRFSRGLKTAIILPSGVVFLSAGLFLWMIFALFHVLKAADHSYEVISQARLCEESMVDIETGVRGFLLGGDPEFLQPYNDGLARVDTQFADLGKLVAGNPPQAERWNEMVQSKNLWLQHARMMVAMRRGGQLPTDLDDRLGKSLMDNLRSQFNTFAAQEEAQYRQRQNGVREMKRVLAVSGSILVALLLVAIAVVVRREFDQLASDHRAALRTIRERHDALARSEAELEQQKEWFRVTLSSIGDGVIVTDREGRVVFINAEAERLTGWTAVEALLKPLPAVFNILDEETRQKTEDPVETVLRGRKTVTMAPHTLLRSRSGEEWPIEDSAAPIRSSKDEILGVVLVFHSATEMRRAQNTLRQYSIDLEKKVSERTLNLQQAVADLEAFSYTVSHDLRSPLRGMQGFAEALLEDYGDKLDQTGKDYLDRIGAAAARLDRLIQDLLAYTRISRLDSPLVELDLDHLVREIVAHDPHLQPPQAEVRIENKLHRVLGRAPPLTQIVSNLLGNAVKFVRPGEKPEIRIKSEIRGAQVRLWIEDKGIGIEPKDAERIFQMFVRLDESRKISGTGVGLAIVKKAAETLQGAVGVEPNEGKGSRFWVDLNKP